MHQLSGLDMAFVGLEDECRPMHVGAVLVFSPNRLVHPSRIVDVLATRAAGVPELARRVRATWWPPAGMAWERDEDFTAERHILTHRLPRSAGAAELAPLVAELMAEPLPTGQPPWQLHVISGIPGGRFAVLVKLHHCVTDGVGAFTVAGLLFDEAAGPAGPHGRVPRGQARPVPSGESPGGRSLLGAALGWPPRTARAGAAAAARLFDGVTAGMRQAWEAADIAAATLTSVRPDAVFSPVTSMVDSSARRQWASVRLDVDQLHRARKRTGGTLNDVVLAVVAGGLRSWLMHHGDVASVAEEGALRVFVPVSVRDRRAGTGDGGNYLSGYLCDLPVHEPDPIERVHAVTEAMRCNKAAGPRRGAGAFPLLARALPAVTHRVVTPVLGRAAPLLFDAMITTVPFPDVALRLDGAALREFYPIAPLAPGHALSVAVAVYHGSVHVGLLTDPGLLPGVTRLGDAVADAATSLYRQCEAAPPAHT